jgi:hypothetical protein
MVEIPNNYEPGGRHLSVAFQAQIVVPFDQELVGNGAVRAVADRAALAKGLVLENPGPGLLAVALHADVISLGCKDSFWLVDVLTVWVVAVGTGHAFFQDRVAILEAELRFRRQVALEAGPGILIGVYDVNAAPSSGFHVKTARPVTGLTPLDPFPARNKQAAVIGLFEVANRRFVTKSAGFRSREVGALNHRLKRRQPKHSCASSEQSQKHKAACCNSLHILLHSIEDLLHGQLYLAT